jgi:citrate synthase
MFEDIKKNVKNWDNEGEVADYLTKIIRKEAGDGSGLIYGMGHAVYTKSDPRAVNLKERARPLAAASGMGDELALMELIEKLTPGIFAKERDVDKIMCANVDMYSGLVYRMLNIPEELFTGIFAIARIVGWCAHRIEEVATGGRIIRPAYKAISAERHYVNMNER